MGLTMDFDEVISPFSRGQFFNEYWNQKFHHFVGRKGRFGDLLTWDDLNSILKHSRLGTPLFRLSQGGQGVPEDHYTSLGWGNVPRIDFGRLVSCLANGATLVLGCVEELSPRVQMLSESFCDALHSGNYVNLYAGWHSQNGSDLHWDSQDIVVLQLAGRKRWQIFPPTREAPLQGDTDTPPRPTGKPAWDGLLEEGAALYLPRGWWHIAFPINEPSLHLTIGTVPPNGLDLLNWAVLQLRDHLGVRQDLPMIGLRDSQVQRISALRKALNEMLDDDSVARFWALWEAQTRARASIKLPGAPYEQHRPLKANSRVRLASSHRLSFIFNDTNAEFKAFGKLYGLPRYLSSSLELLSDRHSIAFCDLAKVLSNTSHIDELRRALSVLARAGVVHLEDVEP